MAEPPFLEIQDLHVAYTTRFGRFEAVRGVSCSLAKRETLGIVGESGCGKSTLAFAIMQYLGGNGTVTGGRILYHGQDLTTKSRLEMEHILGARIAMVYQDPQASLNPSLKVGEQIAGPLRTHLGLSNRAVQDRVFGLLDEVRMPDPKGVAQSYPHQLSGGMQQRVVIAMALSCNPDLLIMDEPTTGLDVTTEAAILDLVNELKAEFSTSVIYITHNLGIIARLCDRVAVMYIGEFVEINSVAGLFERQDHPYSFGLLSCVPKLGRRYRQAGGLRSIKGQVPRVDMPLPPGCVFEPRCPHAQADCLASRPPLKEVAEGHLTACFHWREIAPRDSGVVPKDVSEPHFGRREAGGTSLDIDHLHVHFDERRRAFVLFGPMVGRVVKAVDGVSLQLRQNETVGVVGESGSGKTTLASCMVGLVKPTRGTVKMDGKVLPGLAGKRTAEVRRSLQIVMQNPDLSLNPRLTIGQSIGRPLQLFGIARGRQLRTQVARLMETVRLDPGYMNCLPAELSGGQKQRVAIARALAGDPRVAVFDEAVSALDVSVQASILNVIVDLRIQRGFSAIFVSHDLGVVQYIADRICVMYLGHIVEVGTVEQVFEPPHHPYTEALLSAIPIPEANLEQDRVRLEGTVPSPADPPPGCVFHTRCPRVMGEICRTPPPWQEGADGHRILCHIPLETLAGFRPVVRRLKGERQN